MRTGLLQRLLHLLVVVILSGAGSYALLFHTSALSVVLPLFIVREVPQPADAIVVLAGGVNCQTGELSAQSSARLDHGLTLWQAGWASTLTLSDYTPPSSKPCPSVATLSRQIITQRHGAQGPRTLILDSVQSTRDEAEQAAALAQRQGWKRVLLVTSPTHSRRALLLFRQLGVPVVSVPASSTFDTSLPTYWERRLAAYEVGRELGGLVKAWLQGWL